MCFAGFVNGGGPAPRRVSQAMFPATDVQAITNGVHVRDLGGPSSPAAASTATCRAGAHDNAALRYVCHRPARRDRARPTTRPSRSCWPRWPAGAGRCSTPRCFTIGVARRATAYKRNDLLLCDPDAAAGAGPTRSGPLQVVYSGKAHPHDEAGQVDHPPGGRRRRRPGRRGARGLPRGYAMALGAPPVRRRRPVAATRRSPPTRRRAPAA